MPKFSVAACGFALAVTVLSSSAASADETSFTQKAVVVDSIDPSGKSIAGQKPEPPKGGNHLAERLQGGPQVEWIWGDRDGGERYWLRKEFEAEAGAAALIASCDNQMRVFLNGQRVASSRAWETPVRENVSEQLKDGKNVLLVDARNAGGAAGFALKLVVELKNGKKSYVVTDDSWQAASSRNAAEWKDVVTLGAMGVGPWNNVFAKSSTPLGAAQEQFHALPGFQVELLFTVPKDELGSWVCIAFDEKGRLIASDQGDKGLCRVTPPPLDRSKPTQIERLDVKMTSVQGMRYAFDSLYCSVNGGPGSGFYRLRDTDGNHQYDEVTKLKALQGGGEHGPHAIRLAPGGKSLYVIAGNHTEPPQDFDASRIPAVWDEDLLLPRQWDARGHARGRLAPGGWIAKTDPEGKSWEVVSIGYRNSYDMDFNADGELFAYDADMEWDMGSPWYRPTRLCHAVSGSEFGWRSGTGKWPTWYPDSLPAVVDIGPGSPVGVTFGYGAKFPAKYQRALYLLDWTFGTIYAVHLEPDGASYKGVKDEFLSRTPLPLTDAAVGPDGALYFTVGGRGTQSALYRVTYTGDEPTSPATLTDDEFADLRALRRRLEALHVDELSDATTLDFIWEHLAHADRFIRYAARIALEHRPVDTWLQRALAEKIPQRSTMAAIALARHADKSHQPQILESLDRIDIAKLPEPQQLDLLRAYALIFIRMEAPDQAFARRLAAQLDPLYPSRSRPLNRELSSMLVYLNSPTVISKTLELMQQKYERSPVEMSELLARNPGYGKTITQMLENQPEIENIHLAFVLRNARYGWSLDERKQYLAWLAEAREKSGGASFQGFIDNIRSEALANASEAERKALENEVALAPPKLDELPKPQGPGRAWTIDQIVQLAENGLERRNFENGKRTFAAAQCIRCHRFDGNGGATGQDLTNLAGRFSIRDLTESIVEPSKVISDQYRASTIVTTEGKVHTGRVLSEQNGVLTVLVDPVDATKIIEIRKDDVEESIPSKVSLMPKDLLSTLNKDEVLDLLAYLLSRGNPQDRVFAERE